MGKQSREKWERRESEVGGGTVMAGNGHEYKTGLEKTCLFIVRGATYLSFFVPLIIPFQFFFPFVSPKTTLFRILTEIILAAYLFLVIHNPKYRPRINALTVALTVFLAIFTLASFTGINFERSFWSTYERMTGLFTMFHLYAFFIVLTSCFKKKEDWEKFLGVSVLVGSILSIYVLKGGSASTRGGGTIGNTSFLAAYMLFDVFFALILFLSNFLKKSGRAVFWQIFSGAGLLIMLPVFLSSTARGAIASFFLGLGLLFLGYLFFSKKKILQRIAVGLALFSMLSIISLAVVQPTPVKNEIKSTLRDMQSRFVVWGRGWDGFLERPVLGWGPENFNVVFQKYFNPCMSLSECGNEVWFDRVHNIVFDTLVTTGIFGLASYLAIFLIAIYWLIRSAHKAAEKRDIFLPLGLAVTLIAYFFQNLLVFDMINSYLVFFLTLALVGYLVGKDKEQAAETQRIQRFNPLLALAILIPMIFILWVGNIQPMVANSQIIKIASSGDSQAVASFFDESLDTWMNKYETREQYAQKLIRSGGQLTGLSAEEKKAFLSTYEKGEMEMEKSIKENDLDFRHYLFLGELYIASYRLSGDTEKIDKAEKILKKAIELSPTNQQGYWQLAEVNLIKGRSDMIISLLKKAVDLDPRVGMSHWYLAVGYKIIGNYQLALEEAVKAKENKYDWRETTDQLRQVIEILRALRMDPAAFFAKDEEARVDFATTYIEANPDDYTAWTGLVAAYANLGKYDKVREAAKQIIRLKPEMTPRVEEFLKSLPK